MTKNHECSFPASNKDVSDTALGTGDRAVNETDTSLKLLLQHAGLSFSSVLSPRHQVPGKEVPLWLHSQHCGRGGGVKTGSKVRV